MERIGIYGGTYNPPHVGHMRAAAHAIEALKLDRLLLIPNNIAPHKQMPEDAATAQQRMDMLRMSAKGLEKTEILDLELQRDGKSYTSDTVTQIRKIYPEGELFLLMGTDMFLNFLTWHEYRTISDQVTLAVFYRGERGEQEAVCRQQERLEEMGIRVVRICNPVTAISSTDLRRMLIFGCADPYLCPGVGDYIRAQGLYDTGRDYKNLPMDALEETVVKLLKENRVAHVLGCRDAAVELARQYGENEVDAARAGLLHDITKALDGPLQLTLCSEYDILLSKFSQENPKTLHALTGSLVAEQVFGENQAVVTAIRYHTTGRPAMSRLEKILYLADYIEANRNFPGVDRLRAAAHRSLDEGMLMGLEMTLSQLREQKRQISQNSIDAARYLREQGVRLEDESSTLQPEGL